MELESDMRSPAVLLVDDNSDAALSLHKALKAPLCECFIHVITRVNDLVPAVKAHRPQVVVLDLVLDESRGVESGYESLAAIRNLDATARIIVLTGHGTNEFGIRALKCGAANFLQKPADISHLAALIKDGISQSNLGRLLESQKDAAPKGPLGRLVGSSELMQDLRKKISYCASTAQAVLLTGETGTGKGVCAQIIHALSSRSSGAFIRCQPHFGTPDLVHSELFGHMKGAFTGALVSRRGLIADAHGGTLFLDELDEIPADTQVALLNVLQEREYRSVGSNKLETSNFRLIAAMNRAVDEALTKGKLRLDFYHRVAHSLIVIPPLRSRMSDVPELAASHLEYLQNQEGLAVFDIERAAISKLLEHVWPGNIRELNAIVENAAYHARHARRTKIMAADIVIQGAFEEKSRSTSFQQQVSAFKRGLITDALKRTGGNRMKAAKMLGIDRTSLKRILARQSALESH